MQVDFSYLYTILLGFHLSPGGGCLTDFASQLLFQGGKLR